MNQELLVYVHRLCMCVSLKARLLELREIGVLILACITPMVCVLVMRGLNVARGSNCGGNGGLEKKCFFPSLLYVRSQIYFSVLLFFFFLSPDKCGDYPLTCIPFTSLCKATPPLQGNESDGFLAVDSDLYLSLCVTVYDSCFTAFCFILFLSLDRKRRRVYIGESLKMTGRNVSVTQLAAVSGFVFHRRRNWSKMSCQMAYIQATLCVHISYLIKIKLSEMSFDRY